MSFPIEGTTPRTGRILREDGTELNEADLQSSIMGRDGGKRINTTDATVPATGYVFTVIKALDDTVIGTVTGNITNMDGATLLAGDEIKGRWTSITLTSGDCIAYQGV